MEKTLVTGATGIIGHSITRALLDPARPGGPRAVRALVRSVDRARGVLPPEVELVQGDVTDPASVRRAVEGCGVVHHAAGIPEQWLADEGRFEQVHVGGTRNLVEAALAGGVRRLVYTSTIDVFAAEKGAVYDESVIDPNPKGTAYERSKQSADRVVVEALDRGLPAVFIHPSAAYGPVPTGASGVNDFIVKLRDGQTPALIPGGMPVVYAPDVGLGHVLAEGAEPGRRFILSEEYRELREMAELVVRELGLRRVPPVMPRPVAGLVASLGELLSGVTKRPPLLAKGQLYFVSWGARPSSARAQRELGWRPTPFEEGLRSTIRFLAGA